MVKIHPELMRVLKNKYLPDLSVKVTFTISNEVANFMCVGNTIICPPVCQKGQISSVPLKYAAKDVLVSILFHEVAHIVDNRPNETFDQLVDSEEFAHKWAIERAMRLKDKVIAKILLVSFYQWRSKTIIIDDSYSTPEHNAMYRRNPYKVASLRNTGYILDELEKIGLTLSDVL